MCVLLNMDCFVVKKESVKCIKIVELIKMIFLVKYCKKNFEKYFIDD